MKIIHYMFVCNECFRKCKMVSHSMNKNPISIDSITPDTCPFDNKSIVNPIKPKWIISQNKKDILDIIS